MIKWIKNELGVFLVILLLTSIGGIVGAYYGYDKAENEYYENIIQYQEAVYETAIELTEAETYLEALEDLYELEIDNLQTLHANEVRYLRNIYLTATSQINGERGLYEDIIEEFGSLYNYMTFVQTWGMYVQVNGYLDAEVYYHTIYDN